MVKIKKLYLFELICLVLILAYPAILYLSHQVLTREMTHGDALLIARVFKGLILDHEHLKDWILPGAPSFFPDWLFFFIPFSLFKDLYHQILLGVLIQFSALYLTVRLIYGQFFPKKEAIYFSLTAYLIFILLSLATINPYAFSFMLWSHVGAFIIGLLCIYLNLKQLENSDQNKTLILTILSFLTALSDGTFIINFSAPIFLSYCYLFLKRSIQLKTLFYSSIPFVGSCLGVAILPHIIERPTLYTSLIPSLHLPSAQASYHFFNYIAPDLKIFYQVYPLFFIMFLAFILILTSNKILSSKKFLKFKLTKNLACQSIFFETFILIGSLTFIGIGTFALNVNIELRYMTVLFFMPILFFFYLLNLLPQNNLIKIGLVSLLFGYCLYLVGKNLWSSDLHIKRDLYPDHIRCIDQVLHQSQYRVGIGQYWNAHPMTQLSRQHVKVVSVNYDLTPFRWNTNNQWFKDNYTFAIVDSLINTTLLHKLNGKPKQIVDCGPWKLWIYPDHQLKTNV